MLLVKPQSYGPLPHLPGLMSQLEKKIAPPPETDDIKSKTKLDLGAGGVAKPGPRVAKLHRGTGIPISVQIVDSAGHLVPGLRFVPPKTVDSRFSFSGPTSREENVAGRVRMKSEDRSAPATVAEKEAEGYLVVVTVKESHRGLRLRGKTVSRSFNPERSAYLNHQRSKSK